MAFLGGASSSSTPSWIYDVFLSFYGEDTRKGFTDHLYAALKRKGIITFKDDEKLERGKNISHELLKAIEKSQYAVVVISKRYAFSKWCLIELTKILECMTKTGMIVLPVFYYVEPSDIRKQKGSFARAFAKHSQNIEVDEEQWKMWRRAMADISNLSGWHIDDSHEATIIEDISRRILDGMNHTPSNIFEGLVGIGSRASKLISLLAIGSNDVRFIGISGMGGIGKTTLANIIYDRVSFEFEARCFVADIREVTQKHGVVYLQTQLVCEILHESGLKIWNIRTGIDMIARSVRNRNVFLVLDDVDGEDQLKALAGSHAWFGQGSRIVVISRNRHLLKQYVDTIYEVVELSEHESLELFCRKAFKNEHPEKNYVELSKDIVHCAQGLPLAIEVFGSYLFGRKMEAWEAAQEQLKAYLKKDILDKLQISYEGLEDSQKRLFLDIACVFDGRYENKLKFLNDYFAIDIEILKDRCLIKDLGRVFRMHDLLKKMGQQIVYRECPSDPGRRSRLCCSEDIMNVLNYNTGTNTIEAIDLDLSLLKGEQLNLEGFSKMKRLKTLRIHNGRSYYAFPAVEWYGDLSNFMLSNELRYLEWVGYHLENLPINFQPNKLLMLKMPHNCIKQLRGWRNFDKVKFVDMSYSRNLIEIPDFSEMSNLVELDLRYCRSLSTVHSSLGSLKRLRKLEMEGCVCLNKLPEEINLESLAYLNLAGCLRLEKFPNIRGNMKSLEFLDLICTAIKELPPSFKGLSSLKYINLCGDKKFTTLANVDHYLLNDMFFAFKATSQIYCCGLSEILPKSSFSRLSCIESLHLGYCKMVDGVIPNDLSWFSSLKYLYLSNNKFRRLSDLMELSQLSVLDLEDCDELEALPKLPLSLKHLQISGCVSLEIPRAEMEGEYSGYAIGVVRFDYDGRPHQILQLPSYQQIRLSSDVSYMYKRVYIVAPALVSKIPKWFNRRITNSFETVESCFQVCQFNVITKTYCGGFVLLILYQVKPDTFQEKRKKQKVDESGKSNYGMFDSVNPTLPHFLCNFQFNEVGTKQSIVLCAPEVPSVGPNAFWAHIPFQCLRAWALVNTKASVKASIESFNLNVEIECGMRVVNKDDLPELAKVISDISPHGLDFETCSNLLEYPCKIYGFQK